MRQLRPDQPPRTFTVPLGTTPTPILGYNPARISAVCTNIGTEVAYISFRADVSDQTGYGIPANGYIQFDTPASVWGICATGAAIVTVIEESGR